MDYSFNDAAMNDPFLSLDTNLDDISGEFCYRNLTEYLMSYAAKFLYFFLEKWPREGPIGFLLPFLGFNSFALNFCEEKSFPPTRFLYFLPSIEYQTSYAVKFWSSSWLQYPFPLST